MGQYGIRFQNQEQAEICVYDLAAEVSKRMKQVSAKGRLLTLKLLKRHPDAPVEPPKFLGHGWCETFNKSVPIANKGGSATDDPAILGSEAVKLLRTMRLDPVELRGVGIQITKLDGATGDRGGLGEREAGQGTLSFGVKRERSGTAKPEGGVKRETEPSTSSDRSPAEQIATSKDDQVPLGESPTSATPPDSPKTPRLSPAAVPEEDIRQAAVNAISGPSRVTDSSDGIDPEFLAALPDDLRQEVKRDFKASRLLAQSRPTPIPRPAAPSVAAPVISRQTSHDKPAPPVATAKPPSVGRHEAAHITRQLRPKLKTQLKASAIAELPLYGAWSRAGRSDAAVVDLSLDGEEEPSPSKGKGRAAAPSAVPEDDDDGDAGAMIDKYSVSELKNLGIDPEVFRELPPDMQKEVVDAERGSSRKRKILHRPADTSRIRAKERAAAAAAGGRGRTLSLSPTRSARGYSVGPEKQQPTRPAIARPAKPALLNATELPDVLNTITKWVESRKGAGPAARDAKKVKAYFVKCMQPESGLGGAEVAIEALQWMRVVLEQAWGAREDFMSDGDDAPWDLQAEHVDQKGPGKQWWATWDDFKDEVQKINTERYGAPLRL